MARLLVVLLLATQVSEATPCKRAQRFVFDPVGARHSVPQLTWDGKRYALIGYDGPPTTLHLTTFDLGKRKPVAVDLGPGGNLATATNGTQIAIAYLRVAPAKPTQQIATSKSVDQPAPVKSPFDAEFMMIDGRRVHAPKHNRLQSYFMVIDTSGKVIIKPIALGDQRPMHISPGVQVAWNARDKEWGVVWSEFNYLKFARIDSKGHVSATVPVVVDGFVHSSSRMVWNGTRYAFLAESGKGIVLYEVDGTNVQSTIVAPGGLEPVLAFDGTRYAVVYRTTRDVPQGPFTGGIKGKAPSVPMTPPPPPLHELQFAMVENGKVTASVVIAASGKGIMFNTPVIAADGGGFVVAWGEQRKSASFDDRLMVTRVDMRGKPLAGYPKRLDDEDVHQGYASIAGIGCDLAISYILGDPNNDVRVGVVNAP